MSLDRVSYRELKENVDAINEDIGDLSELPTSDKSSVVAALSEVFTSAGNGKAAIAAAITGKGVQTAATDTFAQMAQNISSIPTGASNSKCFLLTLASDASFQQVKINPAGDADIAAHRGDSSFVVGIIALFPVSSGSTRMIFCGNNSLHTATSGDIYGVFMSSSSSGLAGNLSGKPAGTDTMTAAGSMGVDSSGVISVFASSYYPLKAGSYMVVCGW